MGSGIMRPHVARVGWHLWVPLLALGALRACGRESATPSTPRQRHVIEIRGMAFHPADLHIAPGDTVVWINRDFVPHTSTATDSTAWDTGMLGQDQSGQFVARSAGELSYVCSLHPTMQGTVIVAVTR